MTVKSRVLFAYALMILIVTAWPGDEAGALPSGFDKVGHGLMFVVLGMLSSWTLPKKHVMVVTGCLMFGVATEIMQLAVPRRSFSWWDIVADGLGAVVGWVVYRYLTSRVMGPLGKVPAEGGGGGAAP